MYSAGYIYEPRRYDDEFHVLNALTDEIALSVQGYLGQESWRSKNGSKISATYFWESMESLQAFATHASISKPSDSTGGGTMATTSSFLRSSSLTVTAPSATLRLTSVLV